MNSKNNKNNFAKIKNEINNIEWDKVTDDWTVLYCRNQFSKNIRTSLNPYTECSKTNPLYMHEKWLERICKDKKLKLSDRTISKICGVQHSTIGYWRKKYKISPKEINGKWIDKRKGYVRIALPEAYAHPELKPIYYGRFVRCEHDFLMEKYLSDHLELEISKKCLIDGKYLKLGCPVHHINHIQHDNRLKNLWVFENYLEHKRAESTLYLCFSDLIKLNQIIFEDGKYYFNSDLDYRCLGYSKIKELLKPTLVNFYKNIDLVKKEIIGINWKEVSNQWTVRNGNKTILLNPYSDCSDDNPLYRHKNWVEKIIKDKRFNLTDSRLGKLCNISKDKAQYWRFKVHKIKKKEVWGFKKFIKNDRIWIKVPKNYGNPYANKNRGFMQEHRYTMEIYLAKNPESIISQRCLINGKYLKPKCEIHHINLDPLDNRLENLWVCSKSNHKIIEASLLFFVDKLLKSKQIVFREGKYSLNFHMKNLNLENI